MLDFLGIAEKFGLESILTTSVLITFVCVVILKYTPLKSFFNRDGIIKSNDKKDYLVMIVVALFTFIEIGITIAQGEELNFGQYFQRFFFIWAFSILFYKLLGMLFIKKLFDKHSDKVIK